jgi:hypothetical protein
MQNELLGGAGDGQISIVSVISVFTEITDTIDSFP